MRAERITLRGITRYRDPVTVDLGALPAGLVAIAGRNGAGKTTLLEAAYAALYGEFPTRPGGLYGVATEKDSRIELHLENGQPYRCVVAVDALRQTTEAYLYGEGDEPLTSGKVREYLAEVERRFGSARLMLSAALSCQSKRGSFLDLSKAERKELLSEILDTGGLQRLAEAARERAKAVEARLERLRGELQAVTAELAQLGAEPDRRADLEARREILAATVVREAAEVERARERYTELRASMATAEQAGRERRQLERDVKQAEADLAAKREAVDRERAARDLEWQRLEAEIGAARADADRLADLEAVETQEAETRAALAEAERVEAQRREQLVADRLAAAEVEQRLKPLRTAKALAEAAHQRAALMGRVPCTTDDQWRDGGGTVWELHQRCPLLEDARQAADDIPELERRIAEADRLEGDLRRLEGEAEDTDAAANRAADACRSLRASLEALRPRLAELQQARAASSRVAELEAQQARVSEEATSRCSRLRAECASLIGRITDLSLRLRELPAEIDAAVIAAELVAVTQEGQTLRQRLEAARGELQAVERDIVREQERQRRLAELTIRADMSRQAEGDLVAEAADWRLLERAFGRDGIQALEIDAAGPELSSLTSELLTSCFGPRFEVRFVTQAPKADGKGSKEVFDVQVLDHERGREGAVDSLSGGEKTIISEAISLALAIYVGRHSGRRYETLWRDETAGALDPDNASRYVAMLRRARVMAGAHQVVYIAQQPAVWEAADAVLWVEDGRVEVRV